MDCELTLSMLRPNISGMKTKLIINRKNQLAFIWSKEGTGISYVLEENGERVITMKNYPFPEKEQILLDSEIESNPGKFMNLLFTSKGFIFHNSIDQYLLKCTSKGVVKDLVKYFK